MSIFLVRYIISLAFGILMTFAFADIPIKQNRKKICAIFGVILLIEAVIYILAGLDGILTLYPLHTHLLLVIILVVFYKVSFFNAALYTMLAYMSCQIPAWLSKLIASFFLENMLVEVVTYVIFVVITSGLIIKTVEDSAKELLGGNAFSDMAFALVPITYYIFDYVTTVWTDILYSGKYYVTQFMPFILCLGYLVFLVAYQRQQKIRRQTYEEKMLLENNLAMVESEMESMKELESIARIYRHDMRHHLQLILDLIHQEKYAQAKDYINENIKAVADITPKRYTDIDTLNLLLGRYEKIAEKENIQCHFDVNIKNTLPLSNMEICALVSNVLENACQANANLPIGERFIDFAFKCHNNMLILSEDNACEDSLTLDGINGNTDWNREHGFGTKSIEAIVKKYDGNVIITAKAGHFHIMILIPNN